MLNLLIREDRYKIRGEYLNRVFNVFLFVTFLILIFYLLILYSINLKINAEHEIVKEQQEEIQNSTFSKEYEEYKKSLEHLDKEYSLISKEGNFIPTEYLNKIYTKTEDKININYINLVILPKDKSYEKRIKAEIRGMAKTRDDLLVFSRKLEEMVGKENVELPIANFVQSVNVAFSLNVIFYNK